MTATLSDGLKGYSIVVGELEIGFERTLRIPDDGEVYPLPPSLGAFPIHRVEDYLDRVPKAWRETKGYFIPMYQSEALWLSFVGSPHAVMVDAGEINAITGKEKMDTLDGKEQNYLVAPDQPWLDGFNAGDGYIRQFVAIPLGSGFTVEEQLSDKEATGGIRLTVFAPKPGAIEKQPLIIYNHMVMEGCNMESSMGLAAGGKMKQEIYEDEYGFDVWDQDSRTEVMIHIVNSETYKMITGQNPPHPPLDAETYTNFGFPWFELYSEGKSDLKGSKQLAAVKTIKDFHNDEGLKQQEPSLEIEEWQKIKLKK